MEHTALVLDIKARPYVCEISVLSASSCSLYIETLPPNNLQPNKSFSKVALKALKMKLALIFLTIFVAISHQQYFHPRMMFGFPWMSPFSQPINDNVNEEMYPGLMGLSSRNGIDQEEEFADIQSRIKGYNSNFNGLSRYSFYRPIPSFNDQQNARFFFNLGNTGNTGNNNANNINNGIFNYNPFFKTATFTLTSTLTLTSVVSCVPSNNFLAGAPPPACRRKRSENGDWNEEEQYSIIPSETLSVMPTALSSEQDRSLDILSSSRDDVVSDELSKINYNLREKRFFYPNKNLFIVSSTLTTYAFVNTTITVTVNLLNPAPVAPDVCVAAPVDPGDIQCVACLPAGLIVCPVAG